MAMNIKNDSVERLATEVARMTGETKTEAIRRALEERKRRLRAGHAGGDRKPAVVAFLKKRVWPGVPKNQIGRTLSRAEEDAILGYGPDGV
jgi:antitoxin VapB